MARQTKRVRVTEYEEPGDTSREAELPNDPAEDTYEVFAGQFGGEGVIVRVYRETQRGKQYCFFGAPSEITPESIRLYHARQSYAHEEGHYVAHVEVHGEFRRAFPISIAPQINTPGAPSSAGMAGEQSLLLKMLMDQNARLEARLLQQPAEREPINAIADAMLKISQMQQGTKQDLPIDTLMKCIELGKNIGGGKDDWKGVLLEVVRESMPTINSIVSSRPAPAAAIPARGEETEKEMSNLDAQLKIGILFLKRKAIAGSDPGLYVDWVVDNRESSPYAELIHSVVSQPFSSFVQIDSELGSEPYQTFFHALYDGIRSAFTEPASGDAQNVDTIRPAGNAKNTTGNGAPGKASGKK